MQSQMEYFICSYSCLLSLLSRSFFRKRDVCSLCVDTPRLWYHPNKDSTFLELNSGAANHSKRGLRQDVFGCSRLK